MAVIGKIRQAFGMRRIVPMLAAVAVGACANQLAAREAFLKQFVGHSDSELVQKLGVPTRTYETHGVKYLAYTESRLEFMPPLPPYAGPPWWLGAYGAAPPQVVNLVCETTFVVAGGIVKSYALRGNACG
jgi:hypothetical protein